jgi:hypothetical protein
MGPIQMGIHVASTSHHVLLYVVVPHGSHARDGWDLFQREPTAASLSCHILPYVDVPHFVYARQGSASFQKERTRRWTLSMQRLDAWIPFLKVNGTVCGRFRDMLARKALFYRYITALR